MTEWVLITMLCGRFCTPQYAEVMASKAECQARIANIGSAFTFPSHYCVPRIKGDAPQGSDK